MSLGVLGTTFVLHNCGPEWRSLGPRVKAVYKLILEHTEKFIRRQKRPFIAYWDFITYLHSSAGLNGEPSSNHGLLLELTIALRDNAEIDPHPIEELTRHPLLKEVRSRLVYYFPETTAIAPHALMRGISARDLMDTKHRMRRKEAGFYREFEIDLGDQRGSVGSLDVFGLAILAVLVQVKADLEIYYETGYRRLRCCDNHQCNAWFVSSAMGSRQRFCSTYCRVQASRRAG